MYERSSSRVLRWLKVPPEPHAPHGDPASLKVFRAGKNYFRLRLFGWGVAQLFALAGIVFWATVFIDVEIMARARKVPPPAPAAPAPAPAATPSPAQPGQASLPATTPAPANAPRDWKDKFADEVNAVAKNVQKEAKKPRRTRANGWEQFKLSLVQLALVLPDWAFPLLWALKILGFILYLVQIPITYSVRRLDYELRWYMVTDRSLRIRHGVWKVSESTMSFANIQQVVVSQGPLQRALGLSDVKVQSAGGGSGTDSHGSHTAGEDMHTGLFHSVTNASEIRDLILDRLRRFRESGLGDPDEKNSSSLLVVTASPASAAPADTLAAAQELLAEARALRAALR